MAMDAGTYIWGYPASGQGTENASATTVQTTGDKAFFVADEGVDVVEVGAIIGNTALTGQLIFTVATAPAVGGIYTVQQTLTGPATNLTSGKVLKKPCKIHLDKGQMLRFSVTTAPPAGNAQFYAKLYPAGSRTLDTLSST